MNVQFSALTRVNSFLSCFVPGADFEKHELTDKNADALIRYLVLIVDALLKSENLYKKRNLVLPEGKFFFTADITELMSTVNAYLYKFDSRVFNFNRTERQTFVFILENLIDYLKNGAICTEEKERETLFSDYRFWIDNFFKIFDQKILGSVNSSKKVNLKNFFNPNDAIKDGLIYSNSTTNFSIFPFAINRASQVLFLTGFSDSGLIYQDIDLGNPVVIRNKNFDLRVFEFLFSNFDFEGADLLRSRLSGESNYLLEKAEDIKRAYYFHKDRLFTESFNILKDLSFENLNIPQVYLLQIKNLINLNRIFEVKRLMQRYILFYPYYSDGYEIMGDIYLKEENYELAQNFYEKVLTITQNNRATDKLKKVKEAVISSKGKMQKQKDENFFDITTEMLHRREEIVGRGKEIREMIEVLISDSRRNLVLVGESGVGKTALIRFLAQKILAGDVPEKLKNMRLKEINFVSLLTGSKYRGQFEEKALKILGEFKLQEAILVLEDVHLMIASGMARGTSLDLVNILKQFLRENSIQVIATTNYEEFKNVIEKDSALLGFFQKITVNELSQEETRDVLKNLGRNIFIMDNISLADEVVVDIVEGARRNIKDKKLPDSAIVVLERAVSKLKYKMFQGETDRYDLSQAEVTEVLSDMLNLPEADIPISLKQRLLDLGDNLRRHIIGQDEAIERLSANIITSKLDFDIKKNRPDGVFLFIGPTGVGKTETAIALSQALYGSENSLIRIDMSEYMERFTYSRFVGAAPGYVGYMDSNQLTDKVRQNPFSIILLDEVEKADSQLLNIFLQVFDAGRLTDARGNVVDFSHTTIIMTSNIGTSLFSRTQMGYQDDPQSGKVSRVSLIKALKKYFSPEFLNRLDEIVIFNHLGEEETRQIVHLQLQGTREQLERIDKELIVKEEAIDFIIAAGYSREYGARNISRALKSHILEKIARLSLEKDWEESRFVVCSLDKDEIDVRLETASPAHSLDRQLVEEIGEKNY